MPLGCILDALASIAKFVPCQLYESPVVHTVGANCVRPNREAADGTQTQHRTNLVVPPRGRTQFAPTISKEDGVLSVALTRDGKPVPYGLYRTSFHIVGVGFPDPSVVSCYGGTYEVQGVS